MCAKLSMNGKSTKDLILEAAFSFYSKPHFDEFSMSELAAKVGITKTAIYRHFENRDAVVKAMRVHFFDLIGSRLKAIRAMNTEENCSTTKNLFAEFISFFAEAPQYVNYFISQFSMNQNFEAEIRNEMAERGFTEESKSLLGFDVNSADIKDFSSIFYFSVSILIFIKIREQLINIFEQKSEVKDFSRKVIDFLSRGFAGSVDDKSVIHATEISDQRRRELDKLCAISEKDLPEENKVFRAMAAVIKKYKLNGVTVERIADELDMAKSSLYFYFDNKNQMIASLVQKELNLLSTIAQENIAEAKTYSEYLYISLRTELSFFMKRQSVIPICGWLLQSNVNDFNHKKECDDLSVSNKWESAITEDLKQLDLGINLYPQMFSFWAGILVVALVIMGDKHGFTEKQTEEAVNYIFSFMQNGAGC